jgi:hypothetical protein
MSASKRKPARVALDRHHFEVEQAGRKLQAYLLGAGWAYSSSTPGCYWMWSKDVDGKTWTYGKATDAAAAEAWFQEMAVTS